MNKRIEKIVEKVKIKGNNIATPRRDQVRKAIEENAFDYMIYQGYDEVYDVKPVEMAATLENIADYWLRSGDMWASINNNCLKVTIKYGYSYLTLYADLKEDKKPSLNTVRSEEVEITYNEEKNGIEVKFNTKPAQEVINDLKVNGFRWHRVKKVWYAKQTEERIEFVNTTFEINQINDEKINVKNFNNIETLKNKYVANWSELPKEIQDFIMSCDSYYICLQECLLYKNNKIVATMGIHKDDYEIEIDSFGAGELMQWSIENGFESVKKDTDKINFENVKVENLNEDIFVNALVPALNKNDTKELNDEEIKEKSYLTLFKVTDIIELNEEQYNYFINNLLDDYRFLEGKGGWECENEEVLYYLGIVVTCKGKETLLIDPSGSSYVRYLNKIVEDIEGKLEKKINSLNIDNKDYKKALENIKEDSLYKINFTLNKVLEDERIILNRSINDIQIVTGLTIKEMLQENKSINLLQLEEYTGNMEIFKEQLEKFDNGEICILMPTEMDTKLSEISFTDRLKNELLRVKENNLAIEKVIEEVEEEKIEMNFDDILESFENVEIKNENRLCSEDLNFLEDLQEKFNNMREKFKIYIEFYRENKLYDLDKEEIKISCDSLEEYFVEKVVFYECSRFIGRIYGYFNNKYNLQLKIIDFDKDYSLRFRPEIAEKNLNWFMEILNYNIILDNIFNQLEGVSFKERGIQEVKNNVIERTRGWKKSNIDIKGKNLAIQNYISFDSWLSDKEYQILYSNRTYMENLFNLVSIFETDDIQKNEINNLLNNISSYEDATGKIFELPYKKVTGVKFYKNGKVQLIFDTGISALEFAQEYLNYKEVA
ncbi:hypothetical protein QTH47_13260 [Clostridium perfringens]|nr:hypothetical protein [Clostridium perfringens]